MAIQINRLAANILLAFVAGTAMVGSSMAATDKPAAVATPADKELNSAVMDALKASLNDDAAKLKVSSKKGVVTLSGWINNAELSTQAREVAAKVPGAKKVYSRVRIWSTDVTK
ncbi:BON domain-containing protein [Rhodoferax sp.]|uniref:BON domain-containing protein n=1 Tax=Rhodoferax sp. TaxID=50421 RepID=UPI0025E78BB6|nr:BON domain-containing protein [Rhodoferax sp.]